MGIELLEIGDKVRKAVIFTIRGCLKSVYNHPFLVGFVCFLILLYRSSPFIFSLLVSASPVLICTAVLLGVLLSYGEPNIPEIEIEEKTTFDSVSIKTGLLGDSTVVDQNGTYFVERLIDDHLDDTAPLIKEKSLEIESNGGEIWEENRDLGDSGHRLDEKLKDDAVESDDENSEADSFDSETVNVDSLDSPPCSPWTRIEERENEERADEEDGFDSETVNVDSLDSLPCSPWTRIKEREDEERTDEEDEFSDSGSDRAESSSPDASMADIMPMLDELHPLLDDEPPQPVRTSHSGSDVASEKSLKSDDESENQDDGNEEDNVQEEKEEMKKSAITWTEEDQKNLMDLGSSEIERNQRLENLILRRRAKKSMSIVPERNLIDLDSADYPFSSLAPISTRRQNPFDSPCEDSYGNSGLPQVPGSAPSVLLPRRNPFDIPYDSSEEKPNLMGDGFKEEVATSIQSRDVIFRRHESFNVGPSNFGPNRKDVRMRPYFVPEGSVSEESSYSSLFQRQSSELSESKVSSVPQTESNSLVEAFEGPLGDPRPVSHQEEDVIREPELISEIENVPELVGHGSQSSEDEYSVEVQIGDVADRDQLESVMEVEASGEHVYRSDSSSSSHSEVSEQVFTEMESEGLPILEERRDVVNVLRQDSTESSNLSVSGSLVVEVPHRAPVYDSTPRGMRTGVPSNVEILPDLLVTHPVYEPRPVDVDIFEQENVKVDFSEVGKETETEVPNEGQFEISEQLFKSQLRDERANGVKEIETVQSLDENLILTPSVERNALPSHEAGEIKEPKFQYLDEVHASIALVEPSGETQITQNMNRPEIQELDHGISPDIISPSSHEFISDTIVATETNNNLFTRTTIEEVDNIKEINKDLLSELHNVGDFSVQQWGSGTSINSVEENNKTKDLVDIHEEGVEYNISELQISETSGDQYIGDVSKTKFIEKDGPDFKASKNEMLSEKEDEARPVSKGDVDFVSEKAESTLPETEVNTLEDVDMVFKETLAKHSENSSVAGSTHETSVLEVRPIEKDGATLDENQSLSEKENEARPVSKGDVDFVSEKAESTLPETEVNKLKDVDMVFKETLVKHSENSSVAGSSHETSVLEVRPIEYDDATLDEKQSLSDSVVRDLHVTELGETLETISELDVAKKNNHSEETILPTEGNDARPVGSVVTNDYGDNISEIPLLKVQSKEDVDFVSRKEFNERDSPDSKMPERKTLSEEENETRSISSLVIPDYGDNMSKIPELGVQSKEDVDFVSRKEFNERDVPDTSENKTLPQEENEARPISSVVNVSKIPESEVLSDEDVDFVSKKDESLQGKANTETTISRMPELEASKIKDIEQAFKEFTSKETIVDFEPVAKETPADHSENSSVVGSTHKTLVLEVGPIKKDDDATMDSKEQFSNLDVSEETRQTFSRSNVSEKTVISEETILPPNDKVLDGEPLKQLKPNSDDELVEVKADEMGSSVVESRVKEISVTTEKSDHKVEASKDQSTASVKGKGKSYSSSSSSSSDSSSSDSEKD